MNGLLSSFDTDGDGEYDNNVDCRWTIVAASNHEILVRILQMDIEYTIDCEYDYLKVGLLPFFCAMSTLCSINELSKLSTSGCGNPWTFLFTF